MIDFFSDRFVLVLYTCEAIPFKALAKLRRRFRSLRFKCEARSFRSLRIRLCLKFKVSIDYGYRPKSLPDGRYLADLHGSAPACLFLLPTLPILLPTCLPRSNLIHRGRRKSSQLPGTITNNKNDAPTHSRRNRTFHFHQDQASSQRLSLVLD